MVVLIVSEYDEVSEVLGPFKDGNEAGKYFKSRLTHEPNFRAEWYEVKEPMIMCKWRNTPFQPVKEQK